MAPRLLLCLLLVCAALPVAARQPAMLAPNGGGADCPVTADPDEDDIEPARSTDKQPVVPRPRPAAVRRGAETEAAPRPPRWHSFLPGMIR